MSDRDGQYWDCDDCGERYYLREFKPKEWDSFGECKTLCRACYTERANCRRCDEDKRWENIQRKAAEARGE